MTREIAAGRLTTRLCLRHLWSGSRRRWIRTCRAQASTASSASTSYSPTTPPPTSRPPASSQRPSTGQSDPTRLIANPTRLDPTRQHLGLHVHRQVYGSCQRVNSTRPEPTKPTQPMDKFTAPIIGSTRPDPTQTKPNATHGLSVHGQVHGARQRVVPGWV